MDLISYEETIRSYFLTLSLQNAGPRYEASPASTHEALEKHSEWRACLAQICLRKCPI